MESLTKKYGTKGAYGLILAVVLILLCAVLMVVNLFNDFTISTDHKIAVVVGPLGVVAVTLIIWQMRDDLKRQIEQESKNPA